MEAENNEPLNLPLGPNWDQVEANHVIPFGTSLHSCQCTDRAAVSTGLSNDVFLYKMTSSVTFHVTAGEL